MNLRRALRLLSLCLMAGAMVRAQDYSHISGIILDDSSASVPGAAVSIVNEETGFRRVAHLFRGVKERATIEQAGQ